MRTEDPFRNTLPGAEIELCCPSCRRKLVVPRPEREVSLTNCPHLDCQRVAIVCVGWASGRKDRREHVTMSLDRFMHGQAQEFAGAFELPVILVLVGLFLLVPAVMWMLAWTSQNAVLAWSVTLVTTPALLLGGITVAALVLDACKALEVRRRIRRARRHGITRARWIPASAPVVRTTYL